MRQRAINFKKLLKGYNSGWVGISSNFEEVVSFGKTLKEVRSKTRKSKEKIYFFPAGENYSGFVGVYDYKREKN